ncbi:homoserine O-acetyltransferase MetX [Aquipuribacter nitratireducens]|uniref:Homoserine O-acetyltransferase n=1 Tax=Aquipuribacter nitratireducens TaxID=650104 RepID=A0ABW0GIT8_9MICO
MVAWREGDPPGGRRFVDVGPLDLEAGGSLPGARVAYETWGTPRRGADGTVANAVLVEHALTGDSHVVGPAGPGHPSPGWWDGVVGPGLAVDTDRWFVVAANVLGGCQGTTGPASPAPDGRAWGSRFPHVSVRDQVGVEARLADALGVRRWSLVVGGSMGGMRALEWAVGLPGRVERCVVLASCAAASGDQLAWCAPQLAAITGDPAWRGGDYHDGPDEGPVTGLGVARRIAHVTYRSRWEMDTRFGRDAQDGEDPLVGGRYAVESYLDHQAGKLARRFDAGSYVLLTRAMNGHDVGRGRGGVAAALGRVRARTTVVGVDSDRLYPTEQQEELAALVPGARYVLVTSRFGHDGFLVETAQVARALADALADADADDSGDDSGDDSDDDSAGEAAAPCGVAG